MAQKAKAVANYFIERAERENRTLTPLQLIKLVYIAHGWHLAVTGEPLIDERIHAWKYGPVVEDLYHAFKEFGGGPVNSKARDIRQIGTSLHFETPELDASDPSYGTAEQVLDRVWKSYAHFSGGSLIDLTHAPDTPWAEAMRTRGRDAVIHDNEIQKHFIQKAKKHHGATG